MILVFVPLTWMAIAAPEPCAAVHVAAVGFTEDAERKIGARTADDIRARGVPVCADAPLSPTPECLAQVPCARDIVRGANAQWLVVIDALRAGAAVQVTAQLFLADGRRDTDVDVARAADEFGAAAVVPGEVLDALVRARDSTPREAPTDTTSRPTDVPSETPPLEADPNRAARDDASATSAEEPGLPPLAVAGVVVAGAGVLVAAVGAATAVGQLGVIQDAASSGADKERAAVLVPVMAGLALAGLVGAGAGAVLLGVGLSGDAADDAPPTPAPASATAASR